MGAYSWNKKWREETYLAPDWGFIWSHTFIHNFPTLFTRGVSAQKKKAKTETTSLQMTHNPVLLGKGKLRRMCFSPLLNLPPSLEFLTTFFPELRHRSHSFYWLFSCFGPVKTTCSGPRVKSCRFPTGPENCVFLITQPFHTFATWDWKFRNKSWKCDIFSVLLWTFMNAPAEDNWIAFVLLWLCRLCQIWEFCWLAQFSHAS